jgi:hypothetical protein
MLNTEPFEYEVNDLVVIAFANHMEYKGKYLVCRVDYVIESDEYNEDNEGNKIPYLEYRLDFGTYEAKINHKWFNDGFDEHWFFSTSLAYIDPDFANRVYVGQIITKDRLKRIVRNFEALEF